MGYGSLHAPFQSSTCTNSKGRCRETLFWRNQQYSGEIIVPGSVLNNDNQDSDVGINCRGVASRSVGFQPAGCWSFQLQLAAGCSNNPQAGSLRYLALSRTTSSGFLSSRDPKNAG